MPKPERNERPSNPKVDKKIVTLLKKIAECPQEKLQKETKKLYEYLAENPEQCVLMDDETYMKMDTSTLSGLQFYTVAEEKDVKESNKKKFFGAKANERSSWRNEIFFQKLRLRMALFCSTLHCIICDNEKILLRWTIIIKPI
ncbi:hypothetical protein ILUMI_25636 [Ignelater luminosus]|uniref:Uncharacterized protein n=1 Tax=Ignelater luminosus TaxID=2038154 RepID=A0A8K0C574_IGNLU|nr:hypothetical protein ILUMI_25636 [Ignelater luminosus]